MTKQQFSLELQKLPANCTRQGYTNNKPLDFYPASEEGVLQDHLKMKTFSWTLNLLLLLLLSNGCYTEQSKFNKSSPRRYPRSTEGGEEGKKCGYTFIVPEQKITGPICVNTRSPENKKDEITRMDIENMKDVLSKQKREIDLLQLVVDVDGNIVNEVKLLRKESRNMNSRVTQLYMQLLHEIIRKRDNSLELSQLENKILNVTTEMLRMTSRYRELEVKYAALTDLVNNQSVTISLLEEQCLQIFSRQDTHSSPPLVPVVPHHIPNSPHYTPGLLGSNEIQRDPGYPRDRDVRPPPDPATSPTKSPFRIPPLMLINEGPFKDCQQAKQAGYSSSGIYMIKPENSHGPMQLWCENSLDPGGWTVIQKRIDGSVNFFTNWDNYKKGFGNVAGEYWLGLENIYLISNQDNYRLLIELEDWSNKKVYAEYSSFRLEPESEFYRLRLGTYQGNAGDSMIWHNGKQFTTLDRDRDMYTGNCAHFHKGGWWYNACAHSNLNGVWYRGGHYRSKHQDGIFWAEYRGGSYSLKAVQMMIRPID